jgi:hypothetical protein
MDSGTVAAVLSVAGVVITGLLTALTAIRTGKDKRERNADRRKIEEETTDVILRRVRRELDRAYEMIDMKDRQLRSFKRWLDRNRDRFVQLGIDVPDIETDEGPSLRDDIGSLRVQIDREDDDRADDRDYEE